MDVYDQMVEFARNELGLSEASARAFATGRAGGEYEAREGWSGMDTSRTVPSGLYAEASRCVAADQAAFAVSDSTAWARVRQIINEQMPQGTEAARRALLAYEARLGGR